MACKVHGHKRKTALGMCLPQVPRTGVLGKGFFRGTEEELTELRMVWDVEVLGGCLLESLFAVPGHVLDGDKAALGEEEEVKVSMGYHDVVGSFDNVR